MNEAFMEAAIAQARLAAAEGEVPVGAVVVRDDVIVGTGRNRREGLQNALCHAELEAINAACVSIGSWRLCDCDMYVTLEPCAMCAGAAVNARIRCIYIGALDGRFGALNSMTRLYELPFNHIPQTVFGLREEECSALLSDFFQKLREQKRTSGGNAQ